MKPFVIILFLELARAQSVIYCPSECRCHMEGSDFLVDCSNAQLSSLPEFQYKRIQKLDLSHNKLALFPTGVGELEDLRHLDLSYNQILALPKDALVSLRSLQVLNLGFNHFRNWVDLEPETTFLPVTELLELNLAGNMLTSLSGVAVDENLQLTSLSLERLNLSDNKIAKITDSYFLHNLPNIKELILSGNPIHSITDLESESLSTLDLGSCKLGLLQPTAFSRLPNLVELILRKNERLALKNVHKKTFVHSDTVESLDLTICNMETIDIKGFGSLRKLQMQHNLVKEIKVETFASNPNLKEINLSSNTISYIEPHSFSELKSLEILDLSFNVLSGFQQDLFSHNPLLRDLNLSWNYFKFFRKLAAPSITNIDLSHNEVQVLEQDTFRLLPNIKTFNLGHNFLVEFPIKLLSDSLENLNLEHNRILSLRNTSLMNLPMLVQLNLSGNRLTTPPRRETFAENRYLEALWLGDNPWICECRNKHFHEFFVYLVEPPRKIADLSTVKCFSPEVAFGHSWEGACLEQWYPTEQAMKTIGQFWIALLVLIIIVGCGYCFYASMKKNLAERERRRREEELEENVSEAVELARQARIRMQQEAQLNAPDPRESHPPCYEDAVRMPKPLFSSLDELSTVRRSKRRRHKGTEEADLQTRVSRFRSENILSSDRVPPRLHPFEMEALERSREPMTPATDQVEEFVSFNSRHTSPYTRRRSKSAARIHSSTGSMRSRASRDSFERVSEDHPSTSKPHSSSQSKESFEQVSNSESKKSGLDMNEDAERYLEEELELLDSKAKPGVPPKIESSSSSSDLEFVEEEATQAVVHRNVPK